MTMLVVDFTVSQPSKTSFWKTLGIGRSLRQYTISSNDPVLLSVGVRRAGYKENWGEF